MPLLSFIILSLLRSELQVPAELHASLSACSAASLPPPYPASRSFPAASRLCTLLALPMPQWDQCHRFPPLVQQTGCHCVNSN